MSRDKQMINDLIEIFDEEYGKRNLITPQNTAEKMTAKGYCKSTEVAEEIFAEFEEIFNKRIAFYTDMAKQSKFTEKHYAETMIKNCKIYLQETAELKKKYTESEKDIDNT